MLTDSDGKISPYLFPIPTSSPDYIETLASRLRTCGGNVADTGNDINASWGDLTGCYHAPEAEELYSVLRPVATDGDTVSEGLEAAASALEDFAGELREIKSDWRALQADAIEFRNRIDSEGDEWREAEGIKGFFGIGESPNVAENEGYVTRGEGLIERYAEAELDCANGINADVPGRTSFEAIPANGELDSDVFYHGYEQDLSELATEWGVEEATTDEHWWVDVGAAVGDYVVGAVEDLGAMVGAHSSEGWFEMSWGDAMAEQWESSAQSLASLVGMYDAESDDWGWAGWGTVGSAWKDAAHAVVPWEEWGERPGYVIGTAVLNIGVTALGAALSATGVGAAVGVPLMAWRGASILSNMGGSRIPDVDIPDVDPQGIGVNLNLPNFAGGSRELFRLDLSGLDLSRLSPQRLTDVKGAVERLVARFGPGGGTEGTETPGGPSTPRTVADDGAEATDTRHHRRGASDEDPTAQDLQDALTLQDVLNPASEFSTEMRDQNQGDFLVNAVHPDPDGPPPSREALESGFGDGPEPDNARVRAGVGGRGDDALTAARDTPRPVSERLVDVTSIGDRGHDGDRMSDRGVDRAFEAIVRDRTPDATNRVDETTPRGRDTDQDDGTDRSPDSRTDGERTSTDSMGREGSSDGPTLRRVLDPGDSDAPTPRRGSGDDDSGSDGSAGDPDPDPDHVPRRGGWHDATNEERLAAARPYIGDTVWTNGKDFVNDIVDLVNRHDEFREIYYRPTDGNKWRADSMIGEWVMPIIKLDPNTGKWYSTQTLPSAPNPKYIGARIDGTAKTLPQKVKRYLNRLSAARDSFNTSSLKREKLLTARKKFFANREPGSENNLVANAESEYSEAQARRTKAAERYGEGAARRAVEENFNGRTKVEYREVVNGKVVKKKLTLPKIVPDPETGGPIKPASAAPGSGSDQFDQIWRAEDADGNESFVVVEAKSRADTRLGERELEENGVVTKKVKQGTREYFESILEEMRLRGGEEKKLAREIRRALRNDRVHYVVARGNPDGNMHGGHSMRMFNITGRDIR
ncbi:hypothetical protein KIK06_28190 [Nocardiopsis sp. EMB25]|uniref:hypothetical protein n=1 Tax=Nocardiopsis sp. EMB25 TaxID=2835867 RepID=UPI002284A86B|nr:hypothetical protein [Nocardiopsis sp. EMB25]MCY9787764.1 hypothetical protein [Nocardiopsis sp. EMB25]